MAIKAFLLGAALLTSLAATQTSATVLYDNGPINGTIGADQISQPYGVFDSFTLSKASVVTGVNFGSWGFNGSYITSVYWAITTAPQDYSTVVQTNVDSTYLFSNSEADVWSSSFSFGGISLAAGTYYLGLVGGTTFNEASLWDTSNGPSTSTQDDGHVTTSVSSHSFQITGTTAPAAAVPEPAAWALMIAGFGMVGAAMRRRSGYSAA